MTKILTTLIGGAVIASSLCADLARVEMGAGIWQQTPSGETKYNGAYTLGGTDTFRENETDASYIWMLIKHPIPILPNIRLEYVEASAEGVASGYWGPKTPVGSFSVPMPFQSSLTMNQYDIIPYYNLLDNTGWITVDLGIDIKLIDASYSVKESTGMMGMMGMSTVYEESEMMPLPMLYFRTRLEIPSTDIGLEADVKYIAYSDSEAADVRVKVDYTLSFIPVVQPAVEVGYRYQKYSFEESDQDVMFNLEYSGVYAGLMLRF